MAGNTWRISPRPHKTLRLNEFLGRGMVAVGWSETGDLAGKSSEDIRSLLRASYSQNRYVGSRSLLSRDVGELERFMNVSKGDAVVVPEPGAKRAFIGVIEGKYRFSKVGRESDFPHQIPVRWLSTSTPVDASKLPLEVRSTLGTRHTILKLKVDAVSLFERFGSKTRRNASNSSGRNIAEAFRRQADAASVLDPANERLIRLARILTRPQQYRFREELRRRYGDACQITECTVMAVVQACHIDGFSGGGSNDLDNGLILRVDLHALFDADLIGIEPDTLKICVSPLLRGTEYNRFAKEILRVRGERPSRERLAARHLQFLRVQAAVSGTRRSAQ